LYFEDQRAIAVMPLLAHAVPLGHQVILFTNQWHTLEAGRAATAEVLTR
jgi:uncharacterized protein YhaN